jgi:hypothetical protein
VQLPPSDRRGRRREHANGGAAADALHPARVLTNCVMSVSVPMDSLVPECRGCRTSLIWNQRALVTFLVPLLGNR